MQVKELAEKLGEALVKTEYGNTITAKHLKNLTPENIEALARVALEYVEEREKKPRIGDLIKPPKDTKNCPGLMGDRK